MTTRHRRFKDAIYEQIARIGKSAASPKRLELLDLLSQAPRTVEALAQQASISVANTSRHLQVLRAARLVEAEKRGLYVEYRVADESVSRLLLMIRSVAEARLGEMEGVVRQYVHDRGAMEPVDGAELLRRVRAGEALVLDVRPPEEYRAGHIPGALSVPLPELKKRLADLPKNREIVAYCRGPYCAWASDAVEMLRKKGFRARRMALGVIDWRMKGFAIETAPPETRS